MTNHAETLSTIQSPARKESAPMVDFNRDVVCLLGLPFDVIGMDAAVDHLRRAAGTDTRCFLSTPNLNFVTMALSDATFRDSVLHSDLSVADGMPLVWIARLLCLPVRERVSGADLFERLILQPAPPISVYFFGGPPGVAQAAAEQLNRRQQGLTCVGFDAGSFGSVDDLSTDDHLARINRSGAQFVVVALGAKKGQAWIERNRARLGAPLISHLGAVVNFVAGNVSRAPERVQAWGLEWLWRIKEQPDLWRRYWADGRQFMWLFVTRVLPYAALIRWHAITAAASSDASVAVIEDAHCVTLTLGGTWDRPQLQPLRDLIATWATSEKHELRIDMTDVRWIDSAFVALMLLAYGSLCPARRFTVWGPDSRVGRIFRFNGAEFLLDAPPADDPSPSH